MPDSINNIEIHSEEVQEIIGAAPAWIIRAGIGVVFIVVLIILISSWFFKYPDIISAQIILTTQNPPAQLRAMSTGRITHIFKSENDYVESKQIIAIVENTTNYRDVLYLKDILDTLQNINNVNTSMILQLGDIQHQYASFIRLVKDLQNFEQLDFYTKKINSINNQINNYRNYHNQVEAQSKLKEKELNLAKKQFERNRHLFKQGVISNSDYEIAEKQYLQEEIAFKNTLSSLSQIKIEISQLEQQSMELHLQEIQDSQTKTIAIREAIENIKSQIDKWQQNYLITSPIKGHVTFTQVWGKHQNVHEGSVVATVIPNKSTSIIGKVQIPSTGAGKVKTKDPVNIKLDNFPHMEFGMLKGQVKNISLVPTVSDEGVYYMAEITIPEGMISNYHRNLVFTQEMKGTAEIITDDIRLLERFFNPIKALIKQNVYQQ